MHGNKRVELEHRGARERDEGGENLRKAGIRELADGVDVTTVNRGYGGALVIHVAGKPVILQTTHDACQLAAKR